MVQTLTLFALMFGLSLAPAKQNTVHITQVDTGAERTAELTATRVNGGWDVRTKNKKGVHQLVFTARTGPKKGLWQVRPGGRAEPLPVDVLAATRMLKPFAKSPRQTLKLKRGEVTLHFAGKQLAVFPKGKNLAFLYR